MSKKACFFFKKKLWMILYSSFEVPNLARVQLVGTLELQSHAPGPPGSCGMFCFAWVYRCNLSTGYDCMVDLQGWANWKTESRSPALFNHAMKMMFIE